MRQQYKYEFSKGSSLVYELIPIFPRLIQVVNESHIGKWRSYYEFMMKVEGRKNHGVRIMHTPRTLLHVFYLLGCAKESLKFNPKHSIAMNLLSSGTISPSSRLIINYICSVPIPVAKPSLYSVFIFPCHFGSIKFLTLCIYQINCMQSIYWSWHGDFSEYK